MTDVTLSNTTQVRIAKGQVEILRSAQRQQGEKMTLEALASWRGWVKERQIQTLRGKVKRWLST